MHFLLLIFKRLVCRAKEDPIKSWLNVELAVSFKVLYQAPHDHVKARHVLQRGKHWVDAVLDSQKILLSKFSRRQNFGWKINSDSHTLDCSQLVRRTRLCPPPPLPRGILYSPQFHLHQETKIRSHGKIQDCGQSTSTSASSADRACKHLKMIAYWKKLLWALCKSWISLNTG